MRALAILAMLAASAHAGVFDVPDNAGPIPDPTLRVDFGLGMHFGWFEAGSTGDMAFGGEPQVALRYDFLSLVARASIDELTRTGAGKYAPPDGDLIRLGADLRASVWRDRALATSKHGTPTQYVRSELWFGAGLGEEHVDWYRGTDTDRRDLALEVGASDWIRFGANQASHAMFFLMLELDIAKPPLDRVMPDHSAHDHSVMFEMGAAFGN